MTRKGLMGQAEFSEAKQGSFRQSAGFVWPLLALFTATGWQSFVCREVAPSLAFYLVLLLCAVWGDTKKKKCRIAVARRRSLACQWTKAYGATSAAASTRRRSTSSVSMERRFLGVTNLVAPKRAELQRLTFREDWSVPDGVHSAIEERRTPRGWSPRVDLRKAAIQMDDSGTCIGFPEQLLDLWGLPWAFVLPGSV
ncbi:hypothetical protein FB107DRAFT_245628 [Schizophyllum commune]